MQLKTVAVSAFAMVALGGLAVTVGPKIGALGGVSSSYVMAKPKKLTVPREEDRLVVVVQLCYWPSDQGEQVQVAWSLGSEVQAQLIGLSYTCRDPFGRSAKLRRGDRAMIGWTVTAGAISKFQARVTVNNREALYYEGPGNGLKLDCVAGFAPCN